MATERVIVSALDVGQGQGTFVEVYDGSAQLTNTLLFDLGSSKSSTTAGGPSIEYIAVKIATMSVPKIDYLSLSHKDRDHVNLLTKLITAINVKISPKKVSIGKVRYGGAKAWYSGDLIKELEAICSDVGSLNIAHTSYSHKDKTWDPIWVENDVYVYILIANIPTDSTITSWSDLNVKNKPDSELANSVSIICSVWWNNNQFIINGDATFVTFQEFNKVFKDIPVFYAPKMVTLPHHGSRKSTFGLSVSTNTASAESTAVVNAFARKIGGNTVTASAEVFGNYHHPSYDVISVFNQYAEVAPWYSDPELDAGRHYLTAYLDRTFKDIAGKTLSDRYVSFETSINVYSTLYRSPAHVGHFLAPPIDPVLAGSVWLTGVPVFPLGVQWTYTVDASGDITLTQGVNRDAVAGEMVLGSIIEKDKVRVVKFKGENRKPPASKNGRLSKKIKIILK